MCIKKKKFLEICEMFPNSAKALKYRAFLRRKFVRKQKQKIENLQNNKAALEQKERNNKIVNQLVPDHARPLDSRMDDALCRLC